jgi:hypothetical protein
MKRLLAVHLLVTVGLASGCGGVWNDLFGANREGSITSGSDCNRAPLEVIIARAGTACSATNPCPGGSYCDANGVCNWMCYANNECGAGTVCACNGQCLADTPPGTDGGTPPPADLSCSKDATLLYKIKPGTASPPIPNEAFRPCQDDQRCPAGSYCDPSTGNCNWDCHPNVACPSPTQTCDCAGHCVTPNAPPVLGDATCRRREDLDLDVNPRSSFLEGNPAAPATWTRTVLVRLSSPNAALLTGTPPSTTTLVAGAQLYLVPGPNTQINCNGSGTWTSQRCVVTRNIVSALGTTGWRVETLSHAPDPIVTRATIQVQVRAVMPAVVATKWHVTALCPGCKDAPQGLDFRYLPEAQGISASQPVPTWTSNPTLPDNVGYRGTLTINGAADSANPSGQQLTVPVLAKTSTNFLLVADPTHTVSSTGGFVVPPPGATPLPTSTFYNINDPRLLAAARADYNGTLFRDAASGALRGTMSVSAPGFNLLAPIITGTLSLNPLPAGTPLPVVPGEPGYPLNPPYSTNAIWQNAYYYTGINALIGWRYSSFWVSGLYSFDRGVATPVHNAKPPIIGGFDYFGLTNTGIGQEACQTAFLNEYAGGLNRSWWFNGKLYDSTVNVPRLDEFLNFCQLNAIYSTQDRRDNWLPCVDGSGWEQVHRDLQSGVSLAAHCADFRNNQQYSGFPVAKDYPTWLAQDCVRIGGPPTAAGDFRVTIINRTNSVLIGDWNSALYVCPQFKRSFVRLPTAASNTIAQLTDATVPETAFCYDPNRSGSTLLTAGRLADGANADNTLEFSGDLFCRDDNGGLFAPRIFPLLTHADRVARGELYASPTDSADLLDACLTELRKPAGTLGQNDGSQGGAYNAVWSTFTDAKCIHMPLFRYAFNNFWGVMQNPSLREKKMIMHLIKQWIEVHSFLSYQSMEEARLRKVLASATKPETAPVATSTQSPGSLEPINLEEILSLANQSWQLPLDLWAFKQQAVIDTLTSPDYRDWSGTLNVYSTYPERKAHQNQWLGLPVVMVEGLNQQLRLLRAYLQEAALDAYASSSSAPNAARDHALVRYSEAIRTIYLVEGVAADMYARVGSGVAWSDRYLTARDELQALRQDVQRAAIALSRGSNPLGIDEDDLPIFFGDPQGTNSRYFASSDYLMNQWAVPAVSTAQGALNVAREAWLQARNSMIQDRMTATERDRRLNEIKSHEGQRIVENCGLTGIDSQDVLDAMQNGTASGIKIQPETCFIDPACLSRASLTAADLTAKVSQMAVKFRLCTLNETAGYRNLPAPMSTCASMGALVNGCTVGDLFSDFNSASVTADAARRADLVCQARLGFRAPLPSARDLIGSLDSSCYRGKMGAAALQVIAARQDVDIARQNWDSAQQSFELDKTYCSDVEKAEMEASMRATLLQQSLDELAESKFAADFAMTQTDSFFSWAGAAAGFLTNPAGVIPAIGSSVDLGYKQQALLAQDAMDRAQRDYDTAMRLKQANDTIRSCWHTVDKSQLAIATAYAQIARRGTDIITAGLQLSNMVNENLQAIRQGSNDVKREKDRFISTVAHHYWTSEKIDRFNKEFAWAKRMTYLAMRAVEYEFQQSLTLRGDVLTASHPDQLEDALRVIDQEVGTRTINRRRPEESSIVLSLRDDVLALVDHSADAVGERRLTPLRGLEGRLMDAKYAVYDKNGKWLGQGIPFNLGPEGALNYRCGERLWRITATVQGDALSDREPGVSLFVMKRNTFGSQFCEGKSPTGARFQYGSVQPSRRLFGESGAGTLESEANGYSTALLYPWFNIRRTDFYKVQYRDGASEELAGRGLYGEYLLLFPAEVLENTASSTDACVAVKRGFPLDQVEDVLLRFDYLSVDNLPDLQQ